MLERSERLRAIERAVSRAFPFVAPVLLVLVLVKAYKFIFAMWPLIETPTQGWHKPSVPEAAISLATTPLVQLLLFGFILWRVRRRFFRRYSPWAFAAAAAAVLVAGKLGVALARGDLADSWRSYALESGVAQARFLANIFRSDFVFAAGYWLFCSVLLAAGATRGRRAVELLLATVTSLLILIIALELAHYLKTGVTGNGELLFYFVRDAAALWFIIQSELDVESIGAIAATLIVGVGALVAMWAIERNEKLDESHDRPAAANRQHRLDRLVGFATALVIVTPVNVQPLYLRLTGDTLTSIGRDILSRPMLAAAMAQAGAGGQVYGTAGAAMQPVTAPRRLNVIIVMMESVRASATTVYNPSLATTPFLDSLARRSLVIEQMHAVIPRTSAAWVSVLQGIYPGANTELVAWAKAEHKQRRMTSLPRLLKPLGYRSAFFVATDLKYENEGELLVNMGFDRIVGLKDFDMRSHAKINYFGLTDAVLLPPMMSWVDSARLDNSPFLLVMMTNVSHHPYVTPVSWPRRTFGDTTDARLSDYLNSVAYTDKFVQDVMKGLDGRGLLDSSIVVILADHGEAFGEHGERLHGYSLYQESIQIPTLIYAPSLFADGRRIGGAWQQIDIVPTVAALLGYKVTGATLAGRSMLDQAPPDRAIFFQSMLSQVSLGMRQGARKYHFSFGRRPMEVYDLDTDPQERHDIASRIDPTEVASVERRLWAWQAVVKATLR